MFISAFNATRIKLFEVQIVHNTVPKTGSTQEPTHL